MDIFYLSEFKPIFTGIKSSFCIYTMEDNTVLAAIMTHGSSEFNVKMGYE